MKLSSVKINKTVDLAKMTVTVDFVEVLTKVKGEKTELGNIVSSYTIYTSDFSDSVIDQATLHGLSQKFGDELACTAEEKDATTVQEAMAWLSDLDSRLKAGKWNAGKRSGNGKVNRVDSAKLESVALPEGISQEQAMALLKQLGLFKG